MRDWIANPPSWIDVRRLRCAIKSQPSALEARTARSDQLTAETFTAVDASGVAAISLVYRPRFAQAPPTASSVMPPKQSTSRTSRRPSRNSKWAETAPRTTAGPVQFKLAARTTRCKCTRANCRSRVQTRPRGRPHFEPPLVRRAIRASERPKLTTRRQPWFARCAKRIVCSAKEHLQTPIRIQH